MIEVIFWGPGSEDFNRDFSGDTVQPSAGCLSLSVKIAPPSPFPSLLVTIPWHFLPVNSIVQFGLMDNCFIRIFFTEGSLRFSINGLIHGSWPFNLWITHNLHLRFIPFFLSYCPSDSTLHSLLLTQFSQSASSLSISLMTSRYSATRWCARTGESIGICWPVWRLSNTFIQAKGWHNKPDMRFWDGVGFSYPCTFSLLLLWKRKPELESLKERNPCDLMKKVTRRLISD